MSIFSWIDKLADKILDFFHLDRHPDNTPERTYYSYQFSAKNWLKNRDLDDLTLYEQEVLKNYAKNLDGQYMYNKVTEDYDRDIWVYVEGKDGKEYKVLFPFSEW